MLGAIDSFLTDVILQCGECARSSATIIRWPELQGQSNASHFGFSTDPTKTTPREGSRSGISSAASTVVTSRHLRPGNGIHCHQEIHFNPATFAPRKAS